MNILMLTYEVVDEGGSFIRCFSLAKNLVKLGHKVTLLASNKNQGFTEKKYIRQGVTVIEIACPLPHRVRHNGTSPFQIIGRIIHVIRNRYDVVHGFGHRPSVFIPAIVHRFLYHRPYVADWADLWGWGGLASCRGGVVGNLMGLADDLTERVVYRCADAVTVISDYLYKRALRYGVVPKHIYRLSIGANVDSIILLDKEKMRHKHRVSQGRPIVVYVGNTRYDAEFLAYSFVELLQKKPKTQILFIGEHMASFDKVIRKFGFGGSVIHKGFVQNDKLGELLACGDVMLLPYTNRAINKGRFPNKLGDYMAAGRPTVANPTGDIVPIFENYKIGLLAPETPDKFADAISHLISYPQMSIRLGKNARTTAERFMSWHKRGKELEVIYQRLLASS